MALLQQCSWATNKHEVCAVAIPETVSAQAEARSLQTYTTSAMYEDRHTQPAASGQHRPLETAQNKQLQKNDKIRGEHAYHSGLLLLRSADRNTVGSATRLATQGVGPLDLLYYHSQIARYCLFVLPSLWMGTKPPAIHSLRSLLTHCRLRVQTIRQSKTHVRMEVATRLCWDCYVTCNNNKK